MVERTVEELGGLDVAVNNIGMLGRARPAPFVEQSTADWNEVVAQNLLLTAACARAEARVMLRHDTGGSLVFVTSGETTRPAVQPEGAALHLQCLPSTSPAHAARSFVQKLADWRAVAKAAGS